MKRKHFADTAEDLYANRHGYLSLSQQNRLRAEFWSQCTVGWSILLMCVAGILSLVYFTPGHKADSPDMVIAVLIVLLLVPLAIVLTWRQWQRCQDDQEAGVESSVGNFSRDSYGSILVRPPRSYGISLEQFHWTVSRDEFLSLSNGDTYRVYYTPRTKMLLSYERAADIRDIPEESEASAGSVFMGTLEESQRVYLSLSNDGELIKVDTDHAAMRDL